MTAKEKIIQAVETLPADTTFEEAMERLLFLAKVERTGLYLRITGAFMNYTGNIGKTTSLFQRLLEFVKQENKDLK